MTQGDRIAQMIYEKISNPTVIEVTELTSTTRGEQGFGSTGYTQVTKTLTSQEIA